jgi:hypothetical protein
MKQSAVEWLVANIDWQLLKNTSLHYEMVVEKAKEMEKQQQDEFAIGFAEWINSLYVATDHKTKSTKELLETYKKEKGL